MTTLVVPGLDDEPWPTLGPQVCDFIESHLVYGPGDVAGQPYRITDDFRAQLYRAYEVYPQGHRAAGRRRFKKCYLEERKGLAKTERAMLVVIVEAHPDGPVRCDGFDAHGHPVGRPVDHPYIPLVSYTVEQTEDLGFNVLRYILENCPLGEDFDVGLDRVLVLNRRGREAGKIVPLAGSPAARDGARTSFQHFDEPHRMTLPRLINAEITMTENLYKRAAADPWGLYTSTAGVPGEDSVAERMRSYAEDVDAGKVDDPRLFFFSRFAPEGMPMETPDDVRTFLEEASGPNVSWSGDIDALVSRWFEPRTDRQYYRRVWGNQWVRSSAQALDVAAFRAGLRAQSSIRPGSMVVAGFDGSKSGDSTALVVTEVATGLQHIAGVWERPEGAPDDWVVPRNQVTAAVQQVADQWKLHKLVADPHKWGPWLDLWSGFLGPKVVQSFDTTKWRQFAYACRAYAAAIADGDVTHTAADAHRFDAHISNVRRRMLQIWEEVDGEQVQLWVFAKDSPGSTNWIDLVVAGALSWEGRMNALAAQPKQRTGRAVFV